MTNPEPRTWSDVERILAGWRRRSVAAFAVRAAYRVVPTVARLESKYGPEAREWLTAIQGVIGLVSAFARGEPVTRFTLDLAAEIARATATATATAARTLGPSPLIEDAELAYAAAAYAADAARATGDARAAAMGTQAARMAAGGDEVPPEFIEDLRALTNGEELELPPAVGRLFGTASISIPPLPLAGEGLGVRG